MKNGGRIPWNVIPICETLKIQFGKKLLPGLFLGHALYAEGIWKGDILVADIEELEHMDASEIYANRLIAKEVLTPMSGESSFSQSHMERYNSLEEIRF